MAAAGEASKAERDSADIQPVFHFNDLGSGYRIGGRFNAPVTNQKFSGDSITLPHSPWKNPGCCCLLVGLIIESHLLPSVVFGFSIVVERGIVKVVHDARMYFRSVVFGSTMLERWKGVFDIFIILAAEGEVAMRVFIVKLTADYRNKRDYF